MSGLNFATALYSGASAINNYNQARKDEYKLENTKNPTYSESPSILSYYQNALQRYNTQPTDTAEYKLQDQNIKQGTAQGVAALQGRRSGAVSSLINTQNNGLLKAAVAGENKKAQEFGVLGNATAMKAAEDQKVFQYNSINPFEKNYNLLAMKAAGRSEAGNAATQNTYNNLMAGSIGNPYGNNNNNDNTNNWWKNILASYGRGNNNNTNNSNLLNNAPIPNNSTYNYQFKNYGTPTGLNY